MQQIDTEIISRAKVGDLEAFREMYQAASGFVFNVVSRVLSNPLDAEEVTQDVFLKIYRNLDKFEARSSFKTWVYRVAVNTALSFGRRLSRDRKQKEMLKGSEPLSESPEAYRRLSQEDHEQLVSTLLSTLSPEQRSCIVLREIEGLSYEEISRALNVNLNTVRTRLKRAREVLAANAKKGVNLK